MPLDEAAPAYKSSEEVLRAVTEAGLAEVEHKLWPLASLKGLDERKGRRKKTPNAASNRVIIISSGSQQYAQLLYWDRGRPRPQTLGQVEE